MEKNDILTRQKSAETKQGNKNKRNITHFTSHDVNFRCRCPAHSQAFSGPLYVGPGQNGRSLQTTTEPTYDYAFEVYTKNYTTKLGSIHISRKIVFGFLRNIHTYMLP